MRALLRGAGAGFLSLAMTIVSMTLVSAVSIADSVAEQGKGYELIEPAPVAYVSGKVEVIEFFSYGCPHCAALEPLVETWQSRIDPARVVFRRMHATYSPLMLWLARGFYTSEVLGVRQNVHAGIFQEIHEKHYPLDPRTVESLATLYARTGVDSDEFLQVATTDKVDALLAETERLQRLYKVDRTPTLIVAAKYRVTAQTAGGAQRMFPVVDSLIRRERLTSQ